MAGASPQLEKRSPKSKAVGDGRLASLRRRVLNRDGARRSPSPSGRQGKGSPGALGQILPWGDSLCAGSEGPGRSVQRSHTSQAGAGRIRPLSCGAPGWVTVPCPWEAKKRVSVVKAGAALTRSRLQCRRREGCFPASPSLAAPREAPLPAQAASDGESLTRC